MIYIPKAQVDSSVVVGIAVVITIIGVSAFGVYYFGFVKPQRAELEDARKSAQRTLNNTLATVNTSQAEKVTNFYEAKIKEAGSKKKITVLVAEITSTFDRERKREDLLSKAKNVSYGSFYTLDNFYDNLTDEINSKSSLSQLRAIEENIEGKATSAWENFHVETIDEIESDEVVMVRRDSPLSATYFSDRENALSFVQNSSWEVLRELKFMGTSKYAVPILGDFQNNPSIRVGSRVDVYEHGYENNTMNLRISNTKILNIIYPKDVLSSISWTYTDDNVSHRYSTDVWEEIKAMVAGSEEASSQWAGWAQRVVSLARDNANLGDYDLQAIYVVEVPGDQLAKSLTKIERSQRREKDLLLISRAVEGKELRDAQASAERTLHNTLATVDTPKARDDVEYYETQIQGADSVGEVSSLVENIESRFKIEKRREDVLEELSGNLGQMDTLMARKATETYRTRVREAGSEGELILLAENIEARFELEKERRDLLSKAENVTHGSFYTLSTFYNDLKNEINSKLSFSGLESLEDSIDKMATSRWRELHRGAIDAITESEFVMVKKDGPLSETHMSEITARSFVVKKSWSVLQKVKFEEMNTFAVPITDVFEHTLTLEEGTRVDVYVNDNGTMTRRVSNTEVLDVVYSKEDLSDISWSFENDNVSHRYLTDVWEEIKAMVAGSEEASSQWADWAQRVVSLARDNANLGDYDLQVIYVVRVSEPEVAGDLVEIERFGTDFEDVALLARIS